MSTSSSSLSTPDRAVRAALRTGRPHEILNLLEPLPATLRRRAWNAVKESADAIDAAPIGERDEQGRWSGTLRTGHHDAACVARLATRTAQAATRVHPVELPIARDIIPRLFPENLPAFVEAWAERFETNPKAWDRNRGIEAMFDWAQSGLIPPLVQRGAVLLLISQPGLSRFLDERPLLIDTTLPMLFEVAGQKGASAAQRDETTPGLTLGAHIIPRLIREGRWERSQVLSWCEHALAMPRSEYELRWFRALRARLSGLA
ncbi:hypothetical protein ACT3SQ_14740 [Brachybacterium sp. AOP42-C2-15]|uniref:hypothetical protein n=1 Tax=unclassified Brachybacterium TaxID=2623841 RepID=UPI003F950FFB